MILREDVKMSGKLKENAADMRHNGRTRKILLVDDSSTSRMAARMLFAHHESYELTSACDGKEGVEKAIAELPDLILMDIEMPRMNGIEACKLLKENAATKNIPVVLLTMRGEDSFVQQAYASGCSDFLTKPVNEQKLATVVKRHLGN
jgi:CheY-like chemotaxis protein